MSIAIRAAWISNGRNTSDSSPWAQNEHPISKTTKTVSLPRPGGTEAEDAEEVTAVYRQGRSRRRTESAETVLEEQDIVFTERRVTWPVKPTAVPDVSGPPLASEHKQVQSETPLVQPGVKPDAPVEEQPEVKLEARDMP